jgi:hypothetical protein
MLIDTTGGWVNDKIDGGSISHTLLKLSIQNASWSAIFKYGFIPTLACYKTFQVHLTKTILYQICILSDFIYPC